MQRRWLFAERVILRDNDFKVANEQSTGIVVCGLLKTLTNQDLK